MDLTSFLVSLTAYVIDIDAGRKGFATKGKTEKGRISYERGISGALYQGAETTYPTAAKYRIQGLPKDAVHSACIAHRTRLRNSLRTPGINMIEKAVLQQRAANMTTVQASYIAKQKKVLT
jgi:hypothetical protein